MPDSITRRRVLLGAAALLAAPAVRAQDTSATTDVLIVGAGAAGLAAARELQRLGRSFILVEARGRLGGRVHTDRSLGDPFEAGAFYIHWAETNPWREIAQGLGVATISELPGQGRFQVLDRRASATDREWGRRRAAFSELNRMLERDPADVPDISLAEVGARQSPEALNAAGGIARLAIGDEPERISARDYARLWAGEDLIVPTGYGALVEAYGAGVPVSLGTTVSAIRWDGPGIEAQTSRGTIRARRAIITVPVGVLAAGGIRFTPELPAATRAGIEGLGMGALTKIALRFEGDRFGIPPGSDIFVLEDGGSFNLECWGFDRNLVLAYMGGDHARAITADGDAAAIARTLDVFVQLAGTKAREHFRGGTVAAWHRDPLAMGCYSHARPGAAEARAKLAAPVGERLWFAGEATGGEGFGGAMTAGGAVLAGRDAARQAARLV